MLRLLPRSTRFPYTTLFRSSRRGCEGRTGPARALSEIGVHGGIAQRDDVRAQSGAVERLQPVTPAIVEGARSEEHTSELQSPVHLVCRLLLEKKKYKDYTFL